MKMNFEQCFQNILSAIKS